MREFDVHVALASHVEAVFVVELEISARDSRVRAFWEPAEDLWANASTVV